MEAIKDKLISESVTWSTVVYSVGSPVLFFFVFFHPKMHSDKKD